MFRFAPNTLCSKIGVRRWVPKNPLRDPIFVGCRGRFSSSAGARPAVPWIPLEHFYIKLCFTLNYWMFLRRLCDQKFAVASQSSRKGPARVAMHQPKRLPEPSHLVPVFHRCPSSLAATDNGLLTSKLIRESIFVLIHNLFTTIHLYSRTHESTSRNLSTTLSLDL